MRILLTNDDGYNAEGINTLDKVLTQRGHEVWMIAPNRQRSGRSHAITVWRDLKLEEISPRHYSFEGTPADCVFFANKGMLTIPGEYVVISGINHGYNICRDLIYSGTAGAACEGACNHHKAIAVSCDKDENGEYPFEDAANFIADKLDMLLSVCADDCFVNVNVPPHANGKWKATEISDVEYYDNYTGDHGNGYFDMEGRDAPELVTRIEEGKDFACVYKEHIIAVNVINIMPSINVKMQAKLAELT